MARFKLNPDPTFKAKVGIPIPSTDAFEDVIFEFKYRNRDDAIAWWESVKEKPVAEAMASMLAGWELDDEFTPENVALLCNNYTGAYPATLEKYLKELTGARAKN